MSQPLEIPTINVKIVDDLRNNDIPTVIMKLKNDSNLNTCLFDIKMYFMDYVTLLIIF